MTRSGAAGLILAGLLATACGGNSTGTSGGYYLRFQTPGGQVSFTSQASLTAAFSQSGNQRLMLATGFDATRNFSITVFDAVPIVEKTYSGYDINVNLGAVVGVQLTYQDASGTVWSIGSGTSNQTVTLTSITATTVMGQFSGTLKASGHADLVVTNGQFFVVRAN
jgi:N-acetylglucosamine-6-phosphate deacetylase